MNFPRSLMIRIFSIICVILIFHGSTEEVYAGPVQWIEVPPTKEGNQWWDMGSVREKNNKLRVLTKYKQAKSDLNEKSNPILYVMDIDCEKNYFRDVSENGIPKFKKDWKSSQGDKLINEVIQQVCQYGSGY